ncbi:hypothetical protein [Spiroplasma floricola]|uniref:Uncharacterized protein n=1 Tax=Spiroplasma floricola 23-6 TaxID=1336749 RepID=A0A2K8SDH6_9MOLU|nr:hypothetical protein [Spiroplasma floricola]AUB31509.1 hypothetical protein SFLOR_v1c04570 [Spiroplasma floricola 23-6]
MLGKYEFKKEEIEEVFIFFEPAVHTIRVLLDEQWKLMNHYNLLDKDFLKIFNFFNNMQYLDQFNEGKDLIAFYYNDFWNILINLNKSQIVDRHRFWPNIISIFQMSKLLDRWIKISYDNLKKGKKILNIKDCLNDTKNIITNYYKHLKEAEKDLFFNKKINSVLYLFENSNNFENMEKCAELILETIEEKQINNNKIHNIFEPDSQDYWNTFNILTRISILSSFAILLKN